MAESHISIYTTDFLTVNLQRNNDRSIMSEINNLNLPKQQKIQLNACRLYLQVATLSDIVNPDGRTIDQHFLAVITPIQPKSTIRWPNQHLPSHQACKLWKKIIRNVFNISNQNILPNNNQLKEWIVPYSSRQMSHRWNYSKVQNEIYELNQNNIYRYFIQHKDMLPYTLNLYSKELCSEIPQDTIPVSAMEGNYFFLHNDLVISLPSPIKINSFKQYINILS